MSRPRPPRSAPVANDQLPKESASRAVVLIAAALLVLILLRGALAFMPSMTLWSLNLQRFLSPAWAWAPWGLLALSLVPAIARRIEPLAARLGDACADRPIESAVLLGAMLAAACAALPDRLHFTGDFILREGLVEATHLHPIDEFLHFTLPTWLGRDRVTEIGRAVGAIEAFLLGGLAVLTARALGRGAAASVGLTVAFGGSLGLFTGYSKAYGEMTLLALATGIAGLQVVRTGGGLLLMNLSLAVAILVHRSALALVPGAAIAWLLWKRSSGRAWTPAAVATLALPVAALALVTPTILRTAGTVDAAHFASAEIESRGGLLASSLTGMRLLDALNVVTLLAPLAPIAATLVPLFGGFPRRREVAFLVALAMPALLVIPFAHVGGGLFRDTDVFAVPGVTAALLAAWMLAETLRAAPGRSWLAVPLVLAALVPGLQWIAHTNDLERGLARARAFLEEPPRRNESERARTWDFIGSRSIQLGRLDASAEAFRRAVELTPNPRLLYKWGLAEEKRGHLRSALDIFHRAVARDSTFVGGWYAIAEVAAGIPDTTEMRRALEAVLRIQPGNREVEQMLRGLSAP